MRALHLPSTEVGFTLVIHVYGHPTGILSFVIYSEWNVISHLFLFSCFLPGSDILVEANMSLLGWSSLTLESPAIGLWTLFATSRECETWLEEFTGPLEDLLARRIESLTKSFVIRWRKIFWHCFSPVRACKLNCYKDCVGESVCNAIHEIHYNT